MARYPVRLVGHGEDPGTAKRDGNVSDDLGRSSRQFDRDHINPYLCGSRLRFHDISNRSQHGDPGVTTGKGEVVGQPPTPLHDQDSNVDIHPQGCIGRRRSPPEAAD